MQWARPPPRERWRASRYYRCLTQAARAPGMVPPGAYILVAILLHETVHVVQLLLASPKLCCGAPMIGPPPPVPNLGGLGCDKCKTLERAAYEVSCKYLYGNDRDPKLAISRCVDIGLCFSCLHVCQTKNKSEFPGRPVQRVRRICPWAAGGRLGPS